MITGAQRHGSAIAGQLLEKAAARLFARHHSLGPDMVPMAARIKLFLLIRGLKASILALSLGAKTVNAR
jgi:hypothetical protein